MGYFSSRPGLKRVKENEKGFTLTELLVVVSILIVLSAVAMYIHQRFLGHAKERVCQTNLRALQTAVELYVAENEALPENLTRLKREHVEKGYAKAMENKGWLMKAYTFLITLDASEHAYAEFLTYENLKEYGVTEKIFHCPADHNGHASYGINSDMEGESWVDVGNSVILIADCDSHTFNSTEQLKLRHKNRAIGINKSGEIVELDSDMTAAIEKRKDKEGADDGHYKDDKLWKQDDDKSWKDDNYTNRGQDYFKNGKNDDD
jgi:prepilin-type N-terminal cleavage/methylation domain-containing protein